MASIQSNIKKQAYRIEIISPSGNQIIADEPQELGGKDLGFSPKELLAASLAACTSATLRMYADRKNWDLKEVNIKVEVDYSSKESKTVIHRQLEFIGDLDAEQKSRLVDIANACPIHKLLSNPVEINTEIAYNL